MTDIEQWSKSINNLKQKVDDLVAATPKVVTLYSSDFNNIREWRDVCEQLGIDMSNTEVSLIATNINPE